MRRHLLEPRFWSCHWSLVTGPSGHSRTVVWICEYPYRTMRSRPCEDCPGCVTASDPEAEAIRDEAFEAVPCPSKRLH
jgi:hypothetical protein